MVVGVFGDCFVLIGVVGGDVVGEWWVGVLCFLDVVGDVGEFDLVFVVEDCGDFGGEGMVGFD